MGLLTAIFGDPNQKYIQNITPIVDKIRSLETFFQEKNDEELQQMAINWRKDLAAGKTLDDLLPEVFAAVREAARRRMGSGHFDVQMVGAYALHDGKIAEMKTGEGKTSYAVSPAATLNALTGKGVHVVTVNDYLSKRDTGWIGGVYDALGLRVGAIIHEEAFVYDFEFENGETDDPKLRHLKPCSRKEAYSCDITYGTNNEFGFDYLRDNMAPESEAKVQRGFHYAIIDEVDSILIDEARTPLIISAPAEEATDKYRRFASLMPQLKEGEDYNIDEKMRSASLTEEGIKKMEQWLGVENIYTDKGISEVHHIEQALKAHTLFKRDRDYVVKDGEIIIVDEFTGRMMYGRRYSEGLHQAIEAKEGVEIKKESVTMATVTFQNYFRMYEKLAGMTGTAATEAEEFSKIYNLDVIVIPTNRPVARIDRQDLIYKNEEAKFRAVIKDVREKHEKGQPVLLGTISIHKNEILSHYLEQEGIPHNILNAKNHEREAQIIAEAGKRGAVTLATNMAGRGVDIVLGGVDGTLEDKEEIKNLGGLYVIGTERHESRRIDNQLRGRSGRQGDSGESRFYVSLEDDLMRIFGSNRIQSVMERLGLPDDMPIENSMVSKSLEAAQKKVEGHNFDIRKHLLEYDDVINKHREVIYRKRDRILEIFESLKQENTGSVATNNQKPTTSNQQSVISNQENEEKQSREYKSLREMIMEMVEAEIEQVIAFHTMSEDEHEWNVEEIYEVVDTIVPLPLNVRLKMDDIQKTAGDKKADVRARDTLINYLVDLAHKAYDELEEKINKIETGDTEAPLMLKVEKMVLLRAIDMLWVEHIDAIDHLRTGIGLQGYGQKDPLVEYKREAYQMFIMLQNNIQKQVAYSIYKVGLAPVEQSQNSKGKSQNLKFQGAEKEGNYESRLRQGFDGQAGIKNYGGAEAQTPVSATRPAKIAGLASSDLKEAPVEKKVKVGRNDPCPCGSGKKYKKCCGG
ncbi:preprotein translocase subunit SecA [Candidatus Kuenenbacteria bacterium]|nr:preprotein translocase subunit SecA [Candidatus Kuenenbacteria bacterium]